jgi:hypothetical protein
LREAEETSSGGCRGCDGGTKAWAWGRAARQQRRGWGIDDGEIFTSFFSFFFFCISGPTSSSSFFYFSFFFSFFDLFSPLPYSCFLFFSSFFFGQRDTQLRVGFAGWVAAFIWAQAETMVMRTGCDAVILDWAIGFLIDDWCREKPAVDGDAVVL